MKKGKPGGIFYFERLSSLEQLSPSELGRVFIAAMHYAQTGEEPQLKGRAKFAWGFIKPDIDRDDARYAGVSELNTWKAYCRVEKEKGITPLSFEAWKRAREEAEEAGDSRGCPRQPTSTSATVSDTDTTTAAVSGTAATPITAADTLTGGVSETGGPGEETVRFSPTLRRMIDSGMVDISTPEGYDLAVRLNRKVR